jgi:predicted dehydrogenase
MPEPLRIALVGAGHMGKFHAQAVSERPDARLVAVVDVDLERARAIAQPHGARPETDVAALTGQVDAAVVAASTSVHRAVVLSLLEQGIAVLVEKPLAGSAAEAREIAAAVEKTGGVLQVGHILRFDPVTRAIAGRDLKPRYIEVAWMAPFSFRSMDTGVVMDLMIHGLDVVLLVAGEMPDRIDATGGVVVGPHEDFVTVRLHFPSGCVANLTASRMSRTKQRVVRLFAPSAYVKMDYGARTVDVLTPQPGLAETLRHGPSPAGAGLEALVRAESVPVEAKPDALRAQLAAFLAAVRGEAPVPVTAADGARAVEVAQHILAQVHGTEVASR